MRFFSCLAALSAAGLFATANPTELQEFQIDRSPGLVPGTQGANDFDTRWNAPGPLSGPVQFSTENGIGRFTKSVYGPDAIHPEALDNYAQRFSSEAEAKRNAMGNPISKPLMASAFFNPDTKRIEMSTSAKKKAGEKQITRLPAPYQNAVDANSAKCHKMDGKCAEGGTAKYWVKHKDGKPKPGGMMSSYGEALPRPGLVVNYNVPSKTDSRLIGGHPGCSTNSREFLGCKDVLEHNKIMDTHHSSPGTAEAQWTVKEGTVANARAALLAKGFDPSKRPNLNDRTGKPLLKPLKDNIKDAKISAAKRGKVRKPLDAGGSHRPSSGTVDAKQSINKGTVAKAKADLLAKGFDPSRKPELNDRTGKVPLKTFKENVEDAKINADKKGEVRKPLKTGETHWEPYTAPRPSSNGEENPTTAAKAPILAEVEGSQKRKPEQTASQPKNIAPKQAKKQGKHRRSIHDPVILHRRNARALQVEPIVQKYKVLQRRALLEAMSTAIDDMAWK